jgi:hypothetical protein
MNSEHCEPMSVRLKGGTPAKLRARANSKRQQGSRRPVESLRREAGKYLGANSSRSPLPNMTTGAIKTIGATPTRNAWRAQQGPTTPPPPRP